MTTAAPTPEETEAALRFCETCEDGEGYDVPKAMMKRLAELGLVTFEGRGRYERTVALNTLQNQQQDSAFDIFTDSLTAAIKIILNLSDLQAHDFVSERMQYAVGLFKNRVSVEASTIQLAKLPALFSLHTDADDLLAMAKIDAERSEID